MLHRNVAPLFVLAGAALIGCARTSLSAPSGASSMSGGAGGAGGAPVTSSVSGVGAAPGSVSSGSGAGGAIAASTSSGGGCQPGTVMPCYGGAPGTLGVGVCHAGGQFCAPDGQWGPCLGEVTPSAEVCNGLDDDCNAKSDDGFGVLVCGIGACENSVSACQGGKPGICTPLSPLPETCDGIDNDCDGIADNGCTTGCSDGTREGFIDVAMYPGIAGCAGGFSMPGILSTLAPTCGHAAGNTGLNPLGIGCSVTDLCSPGFHVCTGPADVLAHSKTGCGGAAPGPGLFFATRQSSNGCAVCALGANMDPMVCDGASCMAGCAQTSLTANDLFGCGSLGAVSNSCDALDRFSGNLCTALGPPWQCDDPVKSGYTEANVVTKPGSLGGGVLCCAN